MLFLVKVWQVCITSNCERPISLKTIYALRKSWQLKKRGKLSQSWDDTQSCVLFLSKLSSKFVSIFSLKVSKQTPVSRLRSAGKLTNFSRMTTDMECGHQLWGPKEPTEPNLRPGNAWGALATPDSSQTRILLSLQTDVWCFPPYGVFGNTFMKQKFLLS